MDSRSASGFAARRRFSVGNGLRTASPRGRRRSRHLQVFGSVADVDRVLRIEAHAAQSEF